MRSYKRWEINADGRAIDKRFWNQRVAIFNVHESQRFRFQNLINFFLDTLIQKIYFLDNENNIFSG